MDRVLIASQITDAIARLERRGAKGPWVLVVHPSLLPLAFEIVAALVPGSFTVSQSSRMRRDEWAVGPETRPPIAAEHGSFDDDGSGPWWRRG